MPFTATRPASPSGGDFKTSRSTQTASETSTPARGCHGHHALMSRSEFGRAVPLARFPWTNANTAPAAQRLDHGRRQFGWDGLVHGCERSTREG